jgi:maltooligosyltrehalose trehalohydrolase
MSTSPPLTRRLPIGAEPNSEGTHFRVWAPACHRVVVVIEDSPLPAPLELEAEGVESAVIHAARTGYFSGFAAGARPGMTYRMQLDGAGSLLPDPASRFQPKGCRGPSMIVDPAAYRWRDSDWLGVSLAGQVLYELHVGTFTPEGTWDAAAAELKELADLGISVVEIMPVPEFPGRYGWSYDGANLFAPTNLYGEPDALRSFVDTAHQLGLGLILDAVYNHFGSVGEELLRPIAPAFFSKRYENEWGSAINFDGEHSGPVREFFLANVRHWIREYHFDGLRIDATQAFHDTSPRPILLELARAAREAAAGRKVIVLGESEPQVAALCRSAEFGGCELDAVLNDDFHHSAMVRLTGRAEAYYSDHRGTAEEFLAAAKWGYLFQGQRYAWQKNPRGSPALDLAAPQFVNFLQNHDQIANSAQGLRVHELTGPGRYRAMTALLLLTPQTPLLFQGQEFASSAPWLYFNDAPPEEAEELIKGRAKFLSQFPSYALAEIQSRLPDPTAEESFRRCRLDFTERGTHAEIYALHRDLLRLRHRLRPQEARLEGATLGPDLLFLRFLPAEGETALLVVNFGTSQQLASIAQPLVAPPAGSRWTIHWSSEDPRYGGGGTPDLDTPEGWRIPGEAAVLLSPAPRN